ncbi:MAG: AAA family ATPase [Acidimicrobiales bacterium]
MPASSPEVLISLEAERAALARADDAATAMLERLARIDGGASGDVFLDQYIATVVRSAVRKLQQDLIVFGRIDDEQPWRIGLYGIDQGGDRLVIDWRAPFATRFYQATLGEPLGLARRVSYVGCIDDLLIEEFTTGLVSGTSPLLAELSRERGFTMRAAVSTLQSEQDSLVRLDPQAKLVLRGGPGTGKTVVGLHRAAWLVYNDQRLTADRILVLGPSDRFLRYVATVLPTLGEARIMQTTFERLLGVSCAPGNDERWLDVLDKLEARLLTIQSINIGMIVFPEPEIRELVERINARSLPWRDRRKVFVDALVQRFQARRRTIKRPEVVTVANTVWPAISAKQAWSKLRNRPSLEEIGAPADLIDEWLATPRQDGGLFDEVRARFEGVPARYGHAIVDEAQDLTFFQLRAVMRRAEGLTLVGDDAQRSNPVGLGLGRAARELGTDIVTMNTAYRMSAEIADWLNAHAKETEMEAVELLGIRPTGCEVREVDGATDIEQLVGELNERWGGVAVITKADVWDHKGVEYDAVVVDTDELSREEIYLAASRAAHELVVVRRTA